VHRGSGVGKAGWAKRPVPGGDHPLKEGRSIKNEFAMRGEKSIQDRLFIAEENTRPLLSIPGTGSPSEKKINAAISSDEAKERKKSA